MSLFWSDNDDTAVNGQIARSISVTRSMPVRGTAECDRTSSDDGRHLTGDFLWPRQSDERRLEQRLYGRVAPHRRTDDQTARDPLDLSALVCARNRSHGEYRPPTGRRFPMTRELRDVLERQHTITDDVQRRLGIVRRTVFHLKSSPIRNFRLALRTACRESAPSRHVNPSSHK